MTAAVTYRHYTANTERLADAISTNPQVARETEYFLSKIEKVKSVDELMADSRLVNYTMKAYGLEEMSYAKAFVRKLLTEGVDDPEALANQLTDQRYKEFATDFNFARYGETTTAFERTRSGVVERYKRQAIEEEAGNASTGARLALYFDRRAATIDSPYDILADTALLQVVRTYLNLPAQMSYLDIEKQAAIISERIDIEDFQDPEFVKKFLNDFVVRWDVQNPEAPATPTITSLVSGIQTISTDLLAAIQTIKGR